MHVVKGSRLAMLKQWKIKSVSTSSLLCVFITSGKFSMLLSLLLSDYLLLVDCFKSGLALLSQVSSEILLCIRYATAEISTKLMKC